MVIWHWTIKLNFFFLIFLVKWRVRKLLIYPFQILKIMKMKLHPELWKIFCFHIPPPHSRLGILFCIEFVFALVIDPVIDWAFVPVPVICTGKIWWTWTCPRTRNPHQCPPALTRIVIHFDKVGHDWLDGLKIERLIELFVRGRTLYIFELIFQLNNI